MSSGNFESSVELVLRFKIDTGKRVTRLLTGDETTPGNFRRLKARLTLPR